MFLLVRSSICIAMVVAALPNKAPAAPDAAVFDTITSGASATAAAAVDRFCRRDPARCARALIGAASLVDAPPAVAGRQVARLASTPASRL